MTVMFNVFLPGAPLYRKSGNTGNNGSDSGVGQAWKTVTSSLKIVVTKVVTAKNGGNRLATKW